MGGSRGEAILFLDILNFFLMLFKILGKLNFGYSVRGQTVNILGFVNHTVSFVIIEFHCVA